MTVVPRTADAEYAAYRLTDARSDSARRLRQAFVSA